MFSIYKTIAQYHYFYFQQGFSKICSHSATLQHYFSKVSAKSAPFQQHFSTVSARFQQNPNQNRTYRL